MTAALGGCTWAGGSGAGPARAISAWSPGDNLPSGLPRSTLWATHVTWSRLDALRAGVPARMQWPMDSGTDIADPPPEMMAVAGNAVVVATLGRGTATTDVVTLRFINARTGALVASRSLAVFDFTGVRADTIGSEPVVEARYDLTADQANKGWFTDTVFDASGRQVWTNGGRGVSNFGNAGLLFTNTEGLVTSGHTLRLNPGTDMLHHGGSYTVQDLSGKPLLTVPYWAWVDPADPNLGLPNQVQLVGGYAVVINGGPGKTATAAPHARFTVYDLSRGARVVAAPTVTFPLRPDLAHPEGPNPDPQAHVVAACGGKLVLTLTDTSWTGPGIMRVTVLDAATGRTTPPADVPLARNSRLDGALSGLADAACTTMVLDGPIVVTGPIPVQTSIAIDLSRGTLLWHKPTMDPSCHYLSIRGGVIYALRVPTQTMPARLIAIAAATGATLGTGFTAVPLGYTADGTPIFAKVPNDPAPPSPSPSPSPSPASSASRFRWQPPPRLSPTVGVQVWAGQSVT